MKRVTGDSSISATTLNGDTAISVTTLTANFTSQFEISAIPALSVQYDDDTPVFYDDDTYVLYEP